MDGLTQFVECNIPAASLRKRRIRASKLGESLYCAGGCQKMPPLKYLLDGHVGVCRSCKNDALAAPSAS